MCYIFHDWHYDVNFDEIINFRGSFQRYIFIARTCKKCHTHQLKYNSVDGFRVSNRPHTVDQIDLTTLSFDVTTIDWLDCSCEFYDIEIRLFNKIVSRFPKVMKECCRYWSPNRWRRWLIGILPEVRMCSYYDDHRRNYYLPEVWTNGNRQYSGEG